eukprot:SAG31_NODE_4583_length_3118_cov_2.039086_3_plen_62_part_00
MVLNLNLVRPYLRVLNSVQLFHKLDSSLPDKVMLLYYMYLGSYSRIRQVNLNLDLARPIYI